MKMLVCVFHVSVSRCVRHVYPNEQSRANLSLDVWPAQPWPKNPTASVVYRCPCVKKKCSVQTVIQMAWKGGLGSFREFVLFPFKAKKQKERTKKKTREMKVVFCFVVQSEKIFFSFCTLNNYLIPQQAFILWRWVWLSTSHVASSHLLRWMHGAVCLHTHAYGAELLRSHTHTHIRKKIKKDHKTEPNLGSHLSSASLSANRLPTSSAPDCLQQAGPF